jgi:hypothetical protein
MKDPVLSKGMVKLTTPSAGGSQDTLCLPLEYLNGWLFKVDANRYAETDPRRNVIIAYQTECYRVLFRYWKNRSASAFHEQWEAESEKVAALRCSFRAMRDFAGISTIRTAFAAEFPQYIIVGADYCNMLYDDIVGLRKEIGSRENYIRDTVHLPRKPLSDTERQEIRELHRSGVKPLEISRRLGKNYFSVCHIVYRK